jgi:hypothetical protein
MSDIRRAKTVIDGAHCLDAPSAAPEQTPVAEIVAGTTLTGTVTGTVHCRRGVKEKGEPMVGDRVRVFALASAIAAASMSAASSATAANFDGEWSVLVQTPDHCGNSQWGLVIIDGQVHYPGGAFVGGYPAGVAGQVSPSGRVTINVAAGPRFASGTGRLGQLQGRGKWAGQGPSGTCAGVWTAMRVQPYTATAPSGHAAYASEAAWPWIAPQMPMTYSTETYPPPSRTPHR